MGYEDETVVGFSGPRKSPTFEDHDAMVECLEELLKRAKNKEIMGFAYAYVTGEELGGRNVHTNWIGLPGVSKHVMIASVKYLEHDMLDSAVGNSNNV